MKTEFRVSAKTVADAYAKAIELYSSIGEISYVVETEGKKGYVCKICGYVYEGDTLPEDFICPLCKHGASDFEPIE